MKNYISIALVGTSLLFTNAGATVLEGTWFSCEPESETAFWQIVTIERRGISYHWLREWSQNYSAEGEVRVKGRHYVFSGCDSYRGEKDAKCDESRPPIVMEIERFELTRKYKSIDFALKGSGWIRVGKISLKELDRRCEEIRDANISKRISKTGTKE